MARKIPKYCRHNVRNKAYVWDSKRKKRRYLPGEADSPESWQAYERFIRDLEVHTSEPVHVHATSQDGISVAEFAARYNAYAELEYPQKVKRGNIGVALRRLDGTIALSSLTPKHVVQFQEKLAEEGKSRSYIRDLLALLKGAFEWAVVEGLMDVNQKRSIECVKVIAKHKCKPPAKRRNVSWDELESCFPHMSESVKGIVQVCWWNGMRPEEACNMRPVDIERSGNEGGWIYRPHKHKTQHHGKLREIPLLPQVINIVRSRLLRPEDHYCFPSRKHGEKAYTRHSLKTAVNRAYERAGVEKWCPYDLRHSAATRIRSQLGDEAVRLILGNGIRVAQHYGQIDLEKAKEVARKLG